MDTLYFLRYFYLKENKIYEVICASIRKFNLSMNFYAKVLTDILREYQTNNNKMMHSQLKALK